MVLLVMVAVMIGVILRFSSASRMPTAPVPVTPGPGPAVFRPVRTRQLDMAPTTEGPLDAAAAEALAGIDTVAHSGSPAERGPTGNGYRKHGWLRTRPW